MGIQLHQHQIGVALCHGLHGPGADRMLSAQHQGLEAQGEHGFGRLLHLAQNRLRVAEGNLHGTEISKVEVLQIQVELWAIGLQACAHLSDGGGAKAGAGRKEVVPSYGTKEANAAVGRVAPGSHENGAVSVEKPTRRMCVHDCSSLSMKAGMASMAPAASAVTRSRSLQRWPGCARGRCGSGVPWQRVQLHQPLGYIGTQP